MSFRDRAHEETSLLTPASSPLGGGAHTLAELAVAIPPLEPTAPVRCAYDKFSREPTLYALAVVNATGLPIGLINRFKFLEMLSRPFGRDLLTYRSVDAVMDASPLIVDEHVPLDRLSDILVDDESKYIFDGFIVTRDGRYYGIGTGYSLMRLLSERKQDALFHLAHHDPLTGLANRQLFDDRLRQALAYAKRNGRMLAVLYLDVDRFKAVNDSLGHAVGDKLLQGVAERLRSIVRAQDTVARLSGDEFAMVLTELGVPEHGELVAAKLLHLLRQTHLIEAHEINVSASIGIAVFPNDADTAVALVRAADDAVYHAKQFRNTYQRYSVDMRRAPEALLAFSSVRRALDLGHLEVHYQPQVAAGTRALHGVEALVRWRDPIQGLKSTAELIRAAEDAGLIAAVTDFVLGAAMRQVLEWRQTAGRDIALAVNVSGVQMRDGALVAMLQRHLNDTGFPPHTLELEITESTVMRSEPSTMAVLSDLKRLGIQLSVDDFGTGYSSLSRLQRLPVDALKMDRSFVNGIDSERDAGALAQAIIAMAHSLRLIVTAEGVETDRQMAFLETNGCDRMQGYLICPPLPPAEIGRGAFNEGGVFALDGPQSDSLHS
jgi:diguanylate cyclase (GGDEF)-like protein